mmetsp:Transcript_16701/g.45221  ORF Transcript_16701/g.45221 Transcript_16701/m.45221 type:complete len:242 (-) Transcript_16701:2745-3470(-)
MLFTTVTRTGTFLPFAPLSPLTVGIVARLQCAPSNLRSCIFTTIAILRWHQDVSGAVLLPLTTRTCACRPRSPFAHNTIVATRIFHTRLCLDNGRWTILTTTSGENVNLSVPLLLTDTATSVTLIPLHPRRHDAILFPCVGNSFHQCHRTSIVGRPHCERHNVDRSGAKELGLLLETPVAPVANITSHGHECRATFWSVCFSLLQIAKASLTSVAGRFEDEPRTISQRSWALSALNPITPL